MRSFVTCYTSTNIIIIKSRNISWAGHAACKMRLEIRKKISWETCRAETTRSTLQHNIKMDIMAVVLGFIWLGNGSGDGVL
jgi:hypothetical protein